MAQTILPFYKEFADIFEKHEIINWRAKDFWEKLGLQQSYDAENRRRMLYKGLRLLVKANYLRVDPAKSTKHCLSYVETEDLIHLKESMRISILTQAFEQKKADLLKQQREKRRSEFFLGDLMIEHPHLRKYLTPITEDLDRDIKIIDSNLQLMKMILKQHGVVEDVEDLEDEEDLE